MGKHGDSQTDRRSKCKSHLPIICNPTSPTCSNSVLPVHTTSHRTESTGSSKTSSTSCPRLSLKLPFNLKPLLRPIDDATRKHFLATPKINDKAGTLLRGDPLGSAASGD